MAWIIENYSAKRFKSAKRPESTDTALSGSMSIQLFSATIRPDTPLESPDPFPSGHFWYSVSKYGIICLCVIVFHNPIIRRQPTLSQEPAVVIFLPRGCFLVRQPLVAACRQSVCRQAGTVDVFLHQPRFYFLESSQLFHPFLYCDYGRFII